MSIFKQLPGVLCTRESYTLGSRKIWCVENPMWSYKPESRDSLVSYVPGSRFTVSVNLQAHATAFKATLIQNCLIIIGINYTTTFYLCLEIFPRPRTFELLVNSLVSQAPGNSFKMLITQPKRYQIQNGPRTSPIGPGGAVKWKKLDQKISWDCSFKAAINKRNI